MSDKQGAPTLPPLSGGGGIINGGSNGGAPQQTVSFQQVFANVISSANVQQFVLASQVPGPTQVLPRSGTSGQPIGLTRIINLSGAPPRVGVVNVTTASPVGVACATPAPGHQSKLVLTTSPKLVRTSIANMLQRPPAPTTSQPQQQPQQQQQQQQQQQSPSPSLSSSQQQPPAKKKRVTDGGVSIPERPAGQHQHEPPADVMGYRRRIIEHKLRRLNAIRDKYNENLSEYYFLHNSGNILDFLAWKERPPTPRYLSFLKQHQLEPQEVAGGAEEQQKETIATPTTTTAVAAAATTTTASARAAAATVTSQTTSAAATTVATTTTPSAASSESEPQPATTAATVATVATTSSSTVAAVAGASSSSSSTAMTAAVQSSTAINPSTSDCSSSNSGGNSSGNSSNNGSGKPAATTVTVVTVATSSTPMVSDDQGGAEVALSGGTPVAVSTTLPPAVAQLSQQGQVPGRPQGGRHGMIFAFRAAIQSSPVTAHPSPTTTTSTIAPVLVIGSTPVVIDSPKSNTATANNPVSDKTPTSNPADKLLGTPPISSAQPVVKLVKLSPSSIASSSCDTVSNQEQIVEKAKQEAYVMQRIAELQREGLWSEKRLPKVQEPPRPKTHWDYLLEEMVWLSTDFAQERKWKKSAAKKCARMVQKYFQEKALQAQKAEKLEELRLKKIAGFIAKEIKTFWANVEKLVEYKQQTRLEEKRKKALDQHLNFIVDQTEKYSTWLTEGLNKTEGNQSTPASIHSSRISSPLPAEKHSDDDFKPNQDSDDDEETIAKAEEEIKSNHKEEVELLKKESELPLEDFLRELPPNYLEERDMSLSPELREVVEEESDGTKDTDFTVASELSSDDEDTIQKQEQSEKNIDHKQEIDELNAENEMSIEQLMEKYGATSETTMELEDSDEESGKDEDEEDDSESENETEDEDDVQNNSQTQSDDDTTIGLKSLLEDISDENKSFNETSEKQNEMDSVAAIAESIQPKGNTLLTTSVVTKIPFLLKHSLREYQHIGLDWLVTMYERKLNGILADEMGLGKTIQTIALLAHLACEKGNWGPHLIIVPTSVMLNWEMECKKWCPGFKILTYYGSQKERKQKRMGWTKPNAFHVCITSYKLVIQDHQSFRRKKWKYLILDEAQNIKNFKSQRWQLLLNFQTQRRLLLTGTPLQNNLMELWSLMHFLMPNVFQSHREFKEWFSNPVTGMIEGNSEYNENIIRRLHKVLRPFLLRRLKCEVEKQLPKKYEHVVVCRLSKRQRYLYDDFMSRAKTKETLASGNLLSVMNVLMQLRKVCNHPNLFEVRPTVSPFQMDGIDFYTASLAWSALDYDPFKHINLSCLNLHLVDLEFTVTAFVAHRLKKLKTPRKLIEEIDSYPEPPPRCPSGKIKIHVRLSNQVSKANTAPQLNAQQMKMKSFPGILPTPRVGTSPLVRSANSQTPTGQGVTLKVAGGQQMQGFSLQLVPHQGGVKAIPVQTVPQSVHGTASATPTSANISTHKISVSTENTRDGTQKLIYTVKQGEKASFARLVQTSTGNHLILTNPNQTSNALSFPVITPSGQRLHVLPQKHRPGLSSMSVNKVIGNVVTSTGGIVNKPVMRVSPLNISTSQSTGQVQVQSQQIRAVRNIQKNSEKNPTKEIPKSEFYLPELELMRQQKLHAKLKTLANVNEKKCAAFPLYGKDLFSTLKVTQPAKGCEWPNSWFNCASAKQSVRTRRQYFACTESLSKAIKSIEQVVEEMKDIFDKFMIYVPAAQASRPRFHVSHPSPSKLWQNQRLELELNHHLSSKVSLFHPITRSMQTQFPDVRLIQYDCGKLQSLDLLLRKLKYGDHRVLIFTQMTRMLDVLEAFLNYHGYIYLRLDGATRVDQRQVLMERFNNDKRIFCFILSTRSGGIGVNLTGADTVVFYDSDWNPTMDAQAQDRCHRIGQTRDVHIYRLISERTVEENILKKANQKRLLGDLAIEGGNFTTAYFKSSTIQDLFNVDQSETDASERMAEVLEQSKDRERNLQKETTQSDEKTAMGALESALAAVEEDLDVQAAKTAKAEAVADLAEFDENIPVDDADNDEAQISKAEMEVRNLVSQLTPIERFAMRFVEESDGMFSAAQLAAAERELEEQKKEWELDRLRAMREEEERQMRMTDDDENPITFTREDAQNQIWLSDNTMEQMPMWCPPTPPTSDNDVYIDYSLGFLYDGTPMPESQLPPIYVKKDLKRPRIETGHSDNKDSRRPPKVRHKDDSVYAPRSLFDRPAPAMSKMRRDLKLHKYRNMMRPPLAMGSGMKPSPTMKSNGDPEPFLEWMIHEDWALLQAIQIYQGLNLNLLTPSPGHSANWDLVADIVNNVSRIYRSTKQCRIRYDSIIVPREEGKLLYADTTSKKQKKQKSICKAPQVVEYQSKINRPMRTSQLYNQDKNNFFSNMCSQRFDIIRSVSNKRSLTTRPLSVNPIMKNPKHAAVLADSGINYDNPLTPVEVIIQKNERIKEQKEKERLKNAAASTITTEQQQQTAARLVQQQQIIAQQAQQNVQAQQQGQQVSTSPGPSASGIGAMKAVGNVAAAANSPSMVSPSGKARVAVTGAGGTALGLQGSTPTTIVTNLGQRLVATAQNAAVLAQKNNLISYAVNAANKNLTPAQIQYIKQQQQLRQQQQLKVMQAQVQAAGGQKMSVAVSAATAQQRNAVLLKQQQAAIAAATIASGGSVGAVIAQQQAAVAGKQTLATRQVSEADMAALLKRQQQQQLQQGKAVAQVQVTSQAGLAAAQVYATQAGLQVQQGTSATGTPVVVKTAAGTVRAATQFRPLTLNQQQLLAQRKLASGQKVAQLAQVTAKGGVPLLVQQKAGLPGTMTVQQLQVMKPVQAGVSGIQQFAQVTAGQTNTQPSQVVITKPQMQTRVIPVSAAAAAIKQGTIQVVTASTAQLRQGTQGLVKPIINTARASPGPNQVRLQTVAQQQVHAQQQQQQQQQQQSQLSQSDSQSK
ncbi:helicase domino isoform X6 [Copidosoma floridanum]|uniref:helicase domino isoform X6 n=1 Tax=Copidosoma floridanum TaxID=29053 RepID=UPI0006C9DCED|nr:helicase domino isoform X6 [Copidosoma floridanum]